MKLALVLHALPYFLQAALTTLWVSLLGMVLGQVLGALICVMRRVGGPALDRLGAIYVSIFRGVPLLIQLILIYYALPFIGIDVPRLVAAIGGLGLASAAYVSEIFRGALAAIPHGQIEAAEAMGFSRRAVWRRILLPQALRLSLPALVNELILLLKASSLISQVGVTELTRTSMNWASSTYRPFVMYVTAGLLYLLITLGLAGLGSWTERRLAPLA